MLLFIGKFDFSTDPVAHLPEVILGSPQKTENIVR